jgi:Heterokaryon incompatibility protein (HET)
MTSSIYPSRLAKHETRLLKLPACSSRDATVVLECSLESVTLSSGPSYIALSYVWGPPIFNKTIIVNGQPAQITSSLFQTLRSVQELDLTVTGMRNGRRCSEILQRHSGRVPCSKSPGAQSACDDLNSACRPNVAERIMKVTCEMKAICDMKIVLEMRAVLRS